MNGVLCVNKPSGFTSFDVVAKLRGIFRTKKIGHTGTLDPMATGVLPVLIGKATKAASLLPNKDKQYVARVAFGKKTDTLDITGNILEEKNSELKKCDLEECLKKYVGKISAADSILVSKAVAEGRKVDSNEW